MLKSGDGFKQLALTASGDTRDAEYLARTRGERNVVEELYALAVYAVYTLDYEPVHGVNGLAAVDVEAYLLADHHLGELGFVSLCGPDRADVFALSENRYAVGEGEHLVELMGDDYDGLAVVAHTAQDVKELERLLRSENGGGLVKNEYVGASVEHLDYLNGLLFGDGHLVYLLVRVDIKAVLLAYLFYALGRLFDIEFALVKTEDDILRCGEHVHELEMLMDHAYFVVKRVLGGADDHLFTVDENLTVIRIVNSGDHVHQRCFSGAVFAENGEYLAAVDGQTYILVGNDASEAF